MKESYNAFRGNSKIGIKTGVQKPKPLKSSTETKLQLQNTKQEDVKGNRNWSRIARNNFIADKIISISYIYISVLAEDVLCLFDRIVKHLSDKVHKPELISAIITLNAALKVYGENIETDNKANMDRYQVGGV